MDGPPGYGARRQVIVNAIFESAQAGTSRITTQRQERDEVEILTGVFEGKNDGLSDWAVDPQLTGPEVQGITLAIKDTFRPAHADYNLSSQSRVWRDYRGGGRLLGGVKTAMRGRRRAIARQKIP